MNCSHAFRSKLTEADEPAIQELLAKYPLWKRIDARRIVAQRKFAAKLAAAKEVKCVA